MGDQTLFAPEDWVEAAWKVVDGVLDQDDTPLVYDPGTWGPEQASRVLADGDRWHDPVAEIRPVSGG